MKKLSFLSLIFVLFLCTACPYESKVAVGEAIAVDESLIGKWKADANLQDFVEIRKADDKNYVIVENTYNKNDNSFSQREYAAFFAQVDGTSYLNVKVTKSDQKGLTPKGFFLYKFEKTGEGFKIAAVTENIKESFASSADLQGFISKNQNLSFFFEKEVSYKKN